MRDWKKIVKRLLFPPIWIIVVLTIACTVALVGIFINGWEMHPLAYAGYVLSFYTLTVICIICWKVLPGCYKSVKNKMHENQYIDRYMTDEVFKSNVGLYRSLAINLIYVVINAVSGYIYQTYWFVIFAIYYAIIAVMRCLLVRYTIKNQIGKDYFGELKRARLCAYILMTVNLALSAAVLMMVFGDRGFQYQGFLIYVIALYTFYITVTAVTDMIKYRKYNSPILSVTKVIKMTSALFSMLFLETAMFAQFGADTSQEVKRLMIMMTGAGISITVVSMAIYMIVRTTGEINKIRSGNKNGKA